jgi:hypothetical protein
MNGKTSVHVQIVWFYEGLQLKHPIEGVLPSSELESADRVRRQQIEQRKREGYQEHMLGTGKVEWKPSLS